MQRTNELSLFDVNFINRNVKFILLSLVNLLGFNLCMLSNECCFPPFRLSLSYSVRPLINIVPRLSWTLIAAASCLVGTFSHVEHVLLVGVGGAVPHFSDFSQHVRLGDVVVSSPADDTQALYIQCTKVETMPEVSGYSYITRSFQCTDQTLQRAVQKLKHRCEAGNGENTFIAYIEEAKERLHSEESSFARPSIKSDKLFLTKPDGQKIQMEHPKPVGKAARLFREGQPNIRHGTIGAGRLVSRNDHMRREFAEMNGIKAYDAEYDAVLQSLEGNRNDSVLLVRGMADYVDGSNKDWQPYAALVAAAYMKALICNLR